MHEIFRVHFFARGGVYMQQSIEYLNKLDQLEELVQQRNQLESVKENDTKKVSIVEEHIQLMLTEIRKLELIIMGAN